MSERQTVLVNGLKSKTGGGRTILSTYLGLLHESSSPHRYVVLTPSRQDFERFESDNVRIIDIPPTFKRNAFFPVLYKAVFPAILRQHSVNAIVNFGDIVIPTGTPQLYMFDWPYAVYPGDEIWGLLHGRNLFGQKVKLWAFRRWLRSASVVVAQTPTMKSRLWQYYGLENIVIVPNAVPRENLREGEYVEFGLDRTRPKLLYLAHYYPHKNFEVLIPVAERLRAKGLPHQLVITISPEQHAGAREFLRMVEARGLAETIKNVGPVSANAVPSLYRQCDALLMPTLLETFSGAYAEAMYHGKLILTSALDFAQDVCGDAAIYFDPRDAESIVRAIETADRDQELAAAKIQAGLQRNASMPTWADVFLEYQRLLETLLRDARW